MQMAFKNKKIVIYADLREPSRVNDILNRKQDCELRQKKLDTADYILSSKVAVERKSTNDFLQSIIDGRIFKQLSEMKENFEKPLLIIEGKEDIFSLRKIHPNAINGALASIAIEFGIPILWTKSQLETANLLFAIARREQMQKKVSIGIRGKKRFLSLNQQQEFLIAGLPNVNTTLAKKLLKHFETPEKVFTASESELQKVEKIGKEKARKIRRILTRKYEKPILE